MKLKLIIISLALVLSGCEPSARDYVKITKAYPNAQVEPLQEMFIIRNEDMEVSYAYFYKGELKVYCLIPAPKSK